MKYKLIVFVGPQGSGKTTLALALRMFLEKRKGKACIIKLDTYTFFAGIFRKDTSQSSER